MNPISKFARSWQLFRSSVGVIVQQPRLLAFPVVITAATAVILLFFLAPLVLMSTGHSYLETAHWRAVFDTLFQPTPRSVGGHGFHFQFNGYTTAGTACMILCYFASMFVATFFNVAFYHEIMAALQGRPVSILGGMRFAGTRLQAILLWTLFAGLVGLIIRVIEEKLDFVGQLIAGVIGLGWSVAGVFAIPALVREEQSSNPVALLRKSAAVLRRTWGESLIGYVGLSFGSMIILVGSVGLLAAAMFVSEQLQNFWIIGLTGAGWLLGLMAYAYLTNVAGQVYKCALYLYAADGVIVKPYDQDMLDRAWRFKKG